MSDCIDRQMLINLLTSRAETLRGLYGDLGGAASGVRKLVQTLPSIEPEERTAKVIEHDASVTDTDGYKYHRSEYLCGICKKRVLGGDDYCSHCGAKLEWE